MLFRARRERSKHEMSAEQSEKVGAGYGKCPMVKSSRLANLALDFFSVCQAALAAESRS